MLLTRPLAVVTPTVDGDVLAALARAEVTFTPGQLHRLLDAYSVSGIRKTLRRLVAQGIVSGDRVGNAEVYRLNREHLAADAIIELSRLRETLLKRLRTELSGWSDPPTYAALFGSGARGDMRADSDLDIFLVRASAADSERPDPLASWSADVDRLASVTTAWTGNDVRALEMSEVEAKEAVQARDPVMVEIERDAVVLSGDRSFWRLARG